MKRKVNRDKKQLEAIQKLLNQIYEEKHKELIRYALRFTGGDIELAWDVVHNTYVVALEKADEVLASPNPVGWFIRTVYYISMNEMNKAYRTEVQLSDTYLVDSISARLSEGEPLDHILPPDMRDIDKEWLCLRFEREWTYKMLAEKYGMKPEACRQRISRLLRGLSKTMDPKKSRKNEK